MFSPRQDFAVVSEIRENPHAFPDLRSKQVGFFSRFCYAYRILLTARRSRLRNKAELVESDSKIYTKENAVQNITNSN